LRQQPAGDHAAKRVIDMTKTITPEEAAELVFELRAC
jgi:hypothetical protein